MLGGAQLARWVARVLAAALFLVIVAFMVGEGLPSPGQLTTREQLMFGGLFVMLLGALVGWKREAWGGILLLAGFLFFCLVDNLGKQAFRAGVWVAFAPFAVVGLLYLLAAWSARHAGASPKA
jgi:hypothetical protein